MSAAQQEKLVWICRNILGLLCLAGFTIPCLSQTHSTVQYHNLPGTAAVYSNGYLLSWDNPVYSRMTLYGRNAEPAYSVTEHKDGIYYHGWAVDADGVAAGVYPLRGRWEGRIDVFDPSGKLTRTINTGSYVPEHVAFAPDHTLWTAGYNAGNDGSAEDFYVLHHYARDGKKLGEALLWSQIAGGHNSYTALQGLTGGRRLYVANDRLGFAPWSHYGHLTWIEVSFSGTLLAKYDLSDDEQTTYYSPVAMTESGNVSVAIYQDDRLQGWAVLDRSAGAWPKLAGFPKGRIIGSDMDDLVFANQDGALDTVKLVPSNSLAFSKTREDRVALTGRP